MLGKVIGEEQFGFLPNMHIHDVVAVAREVLHTVKKNNLKATIMKLDLLKAYDRVSWVYLRLALLQIRINVNIVNRIMGCLQSASLAVMINGAPSQFFKASRGLRQGCSLSPFLFLLVVEGLSRMIKEAHSSHLLKAIKVYEFEEISHLLFVDDVFCYTIASRRDFQALKRILDLSCRAIGMAFNYEKSCALLNSMSEEDALMMQDLIPIPKKNLDEGFKYLGFCLKPDRYRKDEWGWFIRKVEARISLWMN